MSLTFISPLLMYRSMTDFYMLLLCPVLLVHSFIRSKSFLAESRIFLQNCHLKIETVLLLPFQFVCLSFPFLAYNFQYHVEQNKCEHIFRVSNIKGKAFSFLLLSAYQPCHIRSSLYQDAFFIYLFLPILFCGEFLSLKEVGFCQSFLSIS